MNEITLRKVELKDMPLMQEWMNDEEIRTNFLMRNIPDEKTMQNFINVSFTDERRDYAIINEKDEYQGTISLKQISAINKNAEYAIVLRRKAIGKNIAKQATKEILKIGFEEIKLHKIFLDVAEYNTRAIRFYEKMGFKKEGDFKEQFYINNRFYNLKRYALMNYDFIL